jgi:hypothetical protein
MAFEPWIGHLSGQIWTSMIHNKEKVYELVILTDKPGCIP